MALKSNQLDLSKRVVAYYLLFCIATMLGILGGISYGSYRERQANVANRCLTTIDRTTAALEMPGCGI